jgi:putative hydrolase of the HAD superfamily
MFSAVLFDFGGTLDADGLHWLDRFYGIYEQIGLGSIPQNRIKEAFNWADAQAVKDPGIRKSGFREMTERHVRWQFQKLELKDPAKENEAAEAFWRPAERILQRNRRILETLSYAGLKMGIVSNGYGNTEALCQEAGLIPFLNIILDSAVIGLRKPDPKLFILAFNKLGIAWPEHIVFVGDSFERDMVPAKTLGMTTYWLTGDTSPAPPEPFKVDVVLKSLQDLPLAIRVPQSLVQNSPALGASSHPESGKKRVL